MVRNGADERGGGRGFCGGRRLADSIGKCRPVRPCHQSWILRAPTTYIKGSHFRGYLLREVASLKYTRFERARIIGARALQISLGAPILVDIPEATIDPIEIAI